MCSARSTCCWCRPRRPPTRSSRCSPTRSSSTAGSAPTRISSTCSISAASRCRPACSPTARRSASRCWRPAAATRCSPRSAVCSTPTPSCRWARPAPRSRRSRRCRPRRRPGEIAIAVVGAHLSGMPLNGELKSFGARFLEATQTAPDYRLFALNGKPPAAAGPAARRGRARALDRARGLGAAGRRLRPLRRCDPAAAVDRDARRSATGAA